ncbi:MAG TPA: T9SS type A sorting domain-containing protein, partial [Flavisolibacter sp.]
HGMIYSSGSGATGLWNDAGPGTQGYVIEYGGLPTDPANYLSANRTIAINTVLSVRNLVFNAVKNENAVWLNWSTGAERNSARFDLLYSTNSRDFKKIAEVTAANNSNSIRTYSYKHISPISGSNYYRLRAVDMDGTAILSEIRVVNLKGSYGLYPTLVTNNQFTVTHPLSSAIIVTIKNAVGATVMQRIILDEQTTISAANLPAGIYFAQFAKDGQLMASIRFLKK